MPKCDIVIPVYKAADWVRLCVYAVFANTSDEVLGNVYLINDCDDDFTANTLENLKQKYGKKLIVKKNSKNLGFVKTSNRGMRLSKAKYVLLLNSDCVIADGCIRKLMRHMEKDKTIGLICPLASNAANLTLPIPAGCSYSQVDKVLEKNFPGQNFDACTVVGNCLMISRECIEKVGYLDEAYGTGYGEETDYQFKAMAAGFKAKVAIDTYVFHKAEASFGKSKEKMARLEKNRELFFSRWKDVYDRELKKYNAHDPIKYIREKLPSGSFRPQIDTAFYLDGIVQNAGGVHIVVDLVNYLTINGRSVNIIYNLAYPYKEQMLFTPLGFTKTKEVKLGRVVSTAWITAYPASKIAKERGIEMWSFIQGYEAFFENGSVYGGVELSYRLADRLFTISDFLRDELKQTFGAECSVITNGINHDLIYKASDNKREQKGVQILFVLRNNAMKGDWLLLDVIKRLSVLAKEELTIKVVRMDEYALPPYVSPDSKVKLEVIKGPLSRLEMYQILQECDIYVDASLSEGFGLTALEAMAAGCVPIVSNSGGIMTYLKDGKNGIVIEKGLNNPGVFVDEILKLCRDQKRMLRLSQEAKNTSGKFDFDQSVRDYIVLFDGECKKSSRLGEIVFSENEQRIIEKFSADRKKHARKIIPFEVAKKVVPKPVKRRVADVIRKLYRYMEQ